MSAPTETTNQPYHPRDLLEGCDDPWRKTQAPEPPNQETMQAREGTQGNQQLSWEIQDWVGDDPWAHPTGSREKLETTQPLSAAAPFAGEQQPSSTSGPSQGVDTAVPPLPSRAASPNPLVYQPAVATNASPSPTHAVRTSPVANAPGPTDIPTTGASEEPPPMLLYGRFLPSEDSGTLVRISPVFYEPPPSDEEVYLACHGHSAKGTYKGQHYYTHWHREANKQSEWTMHNIASGAPGRMVIFSAPDPVHSEGRIFLRFNAAERGRGSFYLTTSDAVTDATQFIISNDNDRTSIVVAQNPRIRLLHPGNMAIAGAASTDQRGRQEFDGRLASWAYVAILYDDDAIDFQNERHGTLLFRLRLLPMDAQMDGK